MLSVITSILQYAGLVATTAMAVFSLFYNFTEDVPQSQRKRLTKAGRYALALVVASGAAGIGATVTKDVVDGQKQAEAALERQKQTQEIRLLSVTFEKIEIRLKLDEAIGWRDARFLSEAAQEEICGRWVHLGVPNGIYANWCLSKTLNQINSHGDKNIFVLFVETRTDQIARFISQNYPSLSDALPPQLPFIGKPDSIKDYQPPHVLYFGNTYNYPASDVWFNVPDPSAELKFGNEKFDELAFSITMRVSFAQIMGSELRLGMSLVTSDVTNDGPSLWTRKPAHTPFLLQHLTAVDVYLNGHLLKHVFDRKHDQPTFAATSQWAQEHNLFGAEIFKVTFDRDLIALSQAATP